VTGLEAAAAYHRILEGDPRSAVDQWRWLVEAFRDRGITFAGTPMPTLLRPQFLSASDWTSLSQAGTRLMKLAERVAQRAFGGDPGRLCAFLGTPADEVPWVTGGRPEPDVVLSRLDAFLTPAGPRFIEINNDAPAGFGYSDAMAAVFAELPVFREFASRMPCRYASSQGALVEALVRSAPPRTRSGPLRVAIVDWADVKTRADQEILAAILRQAGLHCGLADPRELAFRDGRLSGPEGPIDLVYRRVVLSELVKHEREVAAFRAAYESPEVGFVNTFRCRLSEDKVFLALLTDESFEELLDPGERAFVAAVVPWTRKVEERRTRFRGREIDMPAGLVAHRADLVLKPAHGYGGREVMVGRETPAAEWDAAVQHALREPWVVQERVEIPEEDFPVFGEDGLDFAPLKVNTNPFYVRGAEPGAVTRCSRSAVINVSAGGGSIPTFVLGGGPSGA
jgi:uncharacterized circularly permuted ATP-grasp superfamily protein